MASQMNWAGKARSNSSAFCQGAPCRANGIDPESYQASMTSGTRWAVCPQSGQPNVTSSTNAGCGSRLDRSCPASSASSAREPTQVMWSFSHSHNGSGVPQYRVRDRAQSTLLRSHSPYRPCLMLGGYQVVFSFSASRSVFAAVVRTYQDGSA